MSQTDADLSGLDLVCEGDFCNRVNIILSPFDAKKLFVNQFFNKFLLKKFY